MSYDSLKVKFGRRPITVVELDLETCANEFGVSPCTAIGAKCYNTFGTCKDTANFSKTTKTYTLVSDNALLPVGYEGFPCITGVDIAPTTIEINGLSLRANVSVACKDFPHHDRGVDPYWDERTTAGSFFAKLKRRNPHVVNRVMRIKSGYLDSSGVIYTKTQTYFIDAIDGPDADGRVTIKGKDLLRITDKAKAPVQSNGKLTAGITNSATTLTVTAGTGSEYGTSGTVRIGDELITFSGRSTDTLTGLTRGTNGTTAAAHSTDDRVQLCLVYSAATVVDVLEDILTTYGGVDGAYIPSADWSDENTAWLGLVSCTTVISSPTGVNELLSEILQSVSAFLWWDAVAAELKFKVDADPLPDETPSVITDAANIIEGSMKVRELEKDRVTRVLMFYNLLTKIDEVKKDNCKNVSVIIDTDAESVNAYGEAKPKEIVTRWISSDAVASEVVQRLLERYTSVPKELTFRLDARDNNIETGDFLDIQTRLVVGDDGDTITVRTRVLEKREVEEGHQWEYRCLMVGYSGGSAFVVAPDTQADWTSASSTEKQTYAFISADTGLMSDGSQGATIV